MKKMIALCLAGLMLLGLCACTPAEEAPEQTTKDLNMETIYEKLEKAAKRTMPQILQRKTVLMTP